LKEGKKIEVNLNMRKERFKKGETEGKTSREK